MTTRTSLSLFAFVALLLAGSAAAQSEASDSDVARRAHRVAQDVMSPFCPGRTLADCPSPDAQTVREQIRALLVQGVEEQEVRRRLEQTYGDAVVGVPRSALGWALPILILLAGVALLVLVLRRLSAPDAAPAPADPADLAAELDRELQSRGL